MKVQRKTIPMDQVSVRSGKRHVHIHTHHHTIVLSAYDDLEQAAYHEFTFDQLFNLLKDLRPGIAEILTKELP